MTQRGRTSRPGSNWGEFGADDQRGRMNLVTREKVLQGIAEVKEGITFCCSLPLDYPGGKVLNPRRAPPRLAATSRDGKQYFCRPLVEYNENMTDVICDDQVLMSLQYSTQWDSFAHVGGRFDADGDGKPELVFYNGWRRESTWCPPRKRTRKAGSASKAPRRRRSASRISPSTARRDAACSSTCTTIFGASARRWAMTT